MSTQPSAPPVRQHFMFVMAQISRQWRRVIDRQLRPRGLTEAMWLPLVHLSRAAAPMRQKDLAASLSLDSSSVVRLIDGLAQAGFIERAEHSDRRAKTIELTILGTSTVQELETLIAASRSEVLSCVSEQELAAAFDVIGRIAARLTAMEQALP